VDRFGLVNRRGAARIAAPVAFLAGVTLAVVLVRSGLDDPQATTLTRAQVTTRATTAATATRRTTTRAQPVFATVESGDTLNQIALDNDTTIERLLELNPDLDPRALQVGQRVRVR
jgi:LysM repeat protein